VCILVVSYVTFYLILMIKSIGRRHAANTRQHSFSQKMVIFLRIFN